MTKLQIIIFAKQAARTSVVDTMRIRHTANAKQHLEQPLKVMGISDVLSIQMEAIFNDWTKISISDNEIKKIIQHALAPR